ncbi:MAG: hypothetical protein VCB26_11070 [Candidatus Hydrogenedentota bacterium]|jgi:hypothetical protein
MNKISIDVSRFMAQKQPLPHEDHYGSWTFIIDGSPITVFGYYAEAKSLAKLYVRMHDISSDEIELDRFSRAGQLHLVN